MVVDQMYHCHVASACHLLDRQRQIQSLLKQEEQLNAAKQALEQEQTEVKGQLEVLQRSFNASRSVGQETRSKASLLHLHLSKLGISHVT